MTRVHTFEESLARGEDPADDAFWEHIYRQAFPTFVSCARNPAGNGAQLLGIDRWVHLSNGRALLIDEKKRARDYGDILLEHVSNERTGAPGWIEKDLQIDYLAYAFLPSRRCYLFPWPLLRQAWAALRGKWLSLAECNRDGFRIVAAVNPNYRSLSVAVPTCDLLDALKWAQVITQEPSAPCTDQPPFLEDQFSSSRR